jgi:riboflavin synthase
MFSGIVEGTGQVLKITKAKNGARLALKPSFSLSRVKLGESVAVNGCCLTVAAKGKSFFEADLSGETLKVTNLGKLRTSDQVNLERPIRLADRIGGHLVQGHVDGIGKIAGLKKSGANLEIRIKIPKKLRRYLVQKGSVTVDGVSLTVNRLAPESLTLFVIPHTLKATNLKARRVGDPVNLEVDMMAKYIESLAR